MREQLLGYLLGAVEEDERRKVEASINGNADLKRDLCLLRRCLEPLAADSEGPDPPPDLARRTCAFVAYRTAVLTMDQQRAASGRWRFHDFVVAAGILVAASLLFFPAISHSRFQAQLANCQDNLRRIGAALMNYSEHHNDYFPYVPSKGNMAVAGIYAPHLINGGYLADQDAFLCPGSIAEGCVPKAAIPDLGRFAGADGAERKRISENSGGSYGITFGHMTPDGQYVGTKYRGRPTFALVADAPSPTGDGGQSANHGGCGQNVLFETGAVNYLTVCRCPTLTGMDDIFCNDEGIIGPGLHADDAVIAPRGAHPVLVGHGATDVLEAAGTP